MTFQIILGLIIGMTNLRLLMACPYGKIKAVNGSCVECPPGYFDLNCSKVCGNGYYGVGCRKFCACNVEYCDPRIGCTYSPTFTTDIGDTARENLQIGITRQKESLIFDLLIINLVTMIMVGCILILTVIMMYCFIRFFRKWTPDKEHRRTGNAADSSSNKFDNIADTEGMQGEVIELHSDNYEPPIIPTERPVNNVYTGIRII